MATPLIGTGGSVTFTSFGGVIAKTWDATVTRTIIDVTGFGNFARHRMNGMFDITGSVSGTLDGASSPFLWMTTTSATVTLQADSGNSIQFNALVENVNLSLAVDAGADVSYNFSLAAGTTTATSFVFSNICTATWTS